MMNFFVSYSLHTITHSTVELLISTSAFFSPVRDPTIILHLFHLRMRAQSIIISVGVKLSSFRYICRRRMNAERFFVVFFYINLYHRHKYCFSCFFIAVCRLLKVSSSYTIILHFFVVLAVYLELLCYLSFALLAEKKILLPQSIFVHHFCPLNSCDLLSSRTLTTTL